MPDERVILRLRQRLQQHGLATQILAEVNAILCERGLMLKEGSAIDATLIAAPSSTKNKDKARDPEMHSSQKGRQWHFGMKAHIGVDADSGLVHTVRCTSGNAHDITQAQRLLHGQEKVVWADAGYQGVDGAPGFDDGAGMSAPEMGQACPNQATTAYQNPKNGVHIPMAGH